MQNHGMYYLLSLPFLGEINCKMWQMFIFYIYSNCIFVKSIIQINFQ